MNKILYTFLLILTVMHSDAQPHVSAPPPVNPYHPFIRSLSVDCTDKIVIDIAAGHPFGLEADLIDFISDNFIGYVVMRDLEVGIFGDPAKESALRQLIDDIRTIDPNIQVGICGSSSASFMNAPFITGIPSNKTCMNGYPTQFINWISDINNTNLPADKTRNHLIGFYLQVSKFQEAELLTNRKACRSYFDALYLDYPFWNTTTSMADMKHEFTNYINLLTVLRILKCNSTCIRFIDAEFLPTDLYKLQGWTAIDQIFDADILIDRIVLPSYTNDASGVFDLRCKTMHFLSDQFSKNGSRIFIKMSAESINFTHCNSTQVPGNYLGDYLNGTAFPNGNMHSVENEFVLKYNNPAYFCQACNCYTFIDNHYATQNLQGNKLAGSIWTPYSMFRSHQLTRRSSSEIITEFSFRFNVYDVWGRVLSEGNSEKDLMQSIDQMPNGLLIIHETRNGKIDIRKVMKMDVK